VSYVDSSRSRRCSVERLRERRSGRRRNDDAHDRQREVGRRSSEDDRTQFRGVTNVTGPNGYQADPHGTPTYDTKLFAIVREERLRKPKA
jgi:hypothetical protein